jgi:hypothetical protein
MTPAPRTVAVRKGLNIVLSPLKKSQEAFTAGLLRFKLEAKALSSFYL